MRRSLTNRVPSGQAQSGIVKVPGIERLRRSIQSIRDRFATKALILLYHRVAELKSDPQLLSVRPQRFAKQLEYLSRHYRVWSLKKLAQAIREEKCLPERVVAVTFDDGYADNWLNAKPLLEAYDTPATVFVTSGYIGQNREFWWDELEHLLLLPLELPESIAVTVNDKTFRWPLGRCRKHSSEKYKEYDTWDVTSSETPTPSHQAYRDLHGLLRPLGHHEQEKALAAMRSQIGCDGHARSGYRAMTAHEIRQLADTELVEVGAHSVTHPVFATQPLDVRWHELVDSKRQLEAILQRSVSSFAYPYGGPTDVGDTSVELTRDAGYEVACTTVPGPVTLASDCCFLPRCLVRDWDDNEFSFRLNRFFHG